MGGREGERRAAEGCVGHEEAVGVGDQRGAEEDGGAGARGLDVLGGDLAVDNERKSVLLTVELPFTVAMSAVESALKKVWETVFSGPFGGVVCPRLKGRRAVSSGFNPVAVNGKRAIPALAPLLATHAW